MTLHDPRLLDARLAHPLHGEGVAASPGTGQPCGRVARAKLRGQLRRRAIAEAVALCALVLVVPLLLADPLDALLGLLAAGGAAVTLWIARRGNDLARAAAALRDPDRAFIARGMPLEDWHAGVPLLPWAQRRAGP